ncbi:hydroquinone glucosyltransferase-like [Macadamia integrifolia]|uniref:hydroquinone glucosyltransferase-like n=1 Tax=Macadamia integrifolia TaxID=60698 RepID=UPI001C4F7316|nr:hydroquinone glucosyltransferase-like [Macadamia integrifolia]
MAHDNPIIYCAYTFHPCYLLYRSKVEASALQSLPIKKVSMERAHIAILPSPGMGHLIPLAELAKRLIHHHHLSITFIIPTTTNDTLSKSTQEILDNLPKTINSVLLPPANLDELYDSRPLTRICHTIARSLPFLRELLKVLSSTTRLTALVVDPFGTDAFDVAKEFKVSPYIFNPTAAMVLSWCLHLPKLDEMYSCEYRDLQEPVKLPGCVALHGRDLFMSIQDRKNEDYTWFLHHCKRFGLAEGIMLNSFMDLEPSALDAIKEGKDINRLPVYPVGPLVQNGSRDGVDVPDCLKWLDDQPHGSVLFVSFGSGGSLSPEQYTELAFGLELSEQRFLWVIRSPTQKAANANFFDAKSIEDSFAFLPEGFLERTKTKGHVLPSLAPQIQVLSHASTGGFLTHCGWNSTLESIVHGVPLIAWPLYAEQRMNAVMLVEDMKVALLPKATEDGIVGREEITAVVKCLMEGEEGRGNRKRMRELKDAATKALSEDGSSTQSLFEVTQKWKTQLSIN